VEVGSIHDPEHVQIHIHRMGDYLVQEIPISPEHIAQVMQLDNCVCCSCQTYWNLLNKVIPHSVDMDLNMFWIVNTAHLHMLQNKLHRLPM
jgi:hypothetical protein